MIQNKTIYGLDSVEWCFAVKFANENARLENKTIYSFPDVNKKFICPIHQFSRINNNCPS